MGDEHQGAIKPLTGGECLATKYVRDSHPDTGMALLWRHGVVPFRSVQKSIEREKSERTASKKRSG